MKLLALPTSPYAARILIQAHEKHLKLAVEYPPRGRTVAEHAAPNPFGRIPVLVLNDDFVIESAAIAEYLEDVHPAPPLRPPDALDQARMRGMVLAVDHYLLPAIRALRGAGEGDGAVRSALEVVDRLQRLINGGGYACGSALTLADCALAPAVFYLERSLAARGQPSALEKREALAGWWRTVNSHVSVSRVIAQLKKAADAAGR